MSKTPSLQFSTRVLGKDVAESLKSGYIKQTVRSRKQSAPFLMRRGTWVPLYLDDQQLYDVRITDIIPTKMSEMSMSDAESGGFEDVGELESALIRAGFRFKPLYEYSGFKILFTVK